MKNYDRVWATVDLDAVKYNMVQMKNHIREDSKIMAVVKTDGYGHEAVPIAHEIEDMPFLHGFAVATVEEALILKGSGIRKPVLVLGYTFPYCYEKMARERNPAHSIPGGYAGRNGKGRPGMRQACQNTYKSGYRHEPHRNPSG